MVQTGPKRAGADLPHGFPGLFHDDAPDRRGFFRATAGLAVLVLAGASGLRAQSGWSLQKARGFALSLPADWAVTTQARGEEIQAKAPDGRLSLTVWWWFPDEPLLGYPDIVAHSKIGVAGGQGLKIRTRTNGRETISFTFDRGRNDRKRLRLMLESDGALTGDDLALFERILAGLTPGGR